MSCKSHWSFHSSTEARRKHKTCSFPVPVPAAFTFPLFVFFLLLVVFGHSVHRVCLSCAVSFIIFCLNHFPVPWKLIDLYFYPFVPCCSAMVWPQGHCHIHSFPFTFDDATKYRRKIISQLKTASVFCTSAPLRGTSNTRMEIFVHSRERKWSKTAHRVSQDCPLFPLQRERTHHKKISHKTRQERRRKKY